MAQKHLSNLLGYRESIRAIDVTLRDGGLVNDFRFDDEFCKALHETNIKSGVDYMEVGYKSSTKLFDPNKYGKLKFCNDDVLFKLFGERTDALKLAVMADVGRCDFRNDILEKTKTNYDLVRVATYINAIPAAIEMIEDAKKKGYEVSCNIMAISTAQESDMKVALEMLMQTPVDCVYIVDSYGALYPEQISRIVDLYMEYATKYGKKVGIHAHNNQQLAFANTIEAVGDGVDWLDATYGGMGRGAGNAAMENLIGFLKNPKYHVYPAIEFIENHIERIKDEGVVWGYDEQYLITGLLNMHPRAAIAFTKAKRKDYIEFYKEITIQD